VPATLPSLTSVLQQVRQQHRWSQLELSFRLGVSQRHVSFVESGRAKPSRGLLLAWLQELDAPLALRNHALLQAGYAPAYGSAPIDDPALAEANGALEHLLHAHDPMPALVLDALWNVVRLNRGGQWLAGILMPSAVAGPTAAPINLLDALAHPDGLTRLVVNLQDVGPAMLARLRQEAVVHPALTPKVEAFAAVLHARLGPQPALHGGWSAPAVPVLTTRYATAVGELAFFSMFTTFGTPQEITLASLRVEHLFAADAATRTVIERHVR
jgi:transcriptional regulator with XRE-family HTH domain